jgi:hypothetical protein
VNIPIADDRLDEHQARIARSEARKAQAERPPRGRKRR